MKEYLTFNSVGGGLLDISAAGKYVLQLENIIAVDSGGYTPSNSVAIWSTTPPDTATTCSYYEFEISGSNVLWIILLICISFKLMMFLLSRVGVPCPPHRTV